jgi:RNA polymerase sigma factor (sigma-70 family)
MSNGNSHSIVWEKFRNGEEGALLELYNGHYLGLINFGRLIIDDRELVNECLTDMLIEFWNKRETLPPVENVRSYLLTSFRRTVLHKLESDKKRGIKHIESQKISETHQMSYEEYIIKIQSDKGLKSKISKALNKLTERQLELVRLKFFEDLDYDEIAEKCAITKRTAYNIIHDALKVLKEELYDDQNSGFSSYSGVILLVLGLNFL